MWGSRPPVSGASRGAVSAHPSGRATGRVARPLALAGPPRHTRGMKKWPPDDYDEYMRRWRRKFYGCMAVGAVIGFALMGYLLYGHR